MISLLQAIGWKVMHARPGRVRRRGVEKYETPFKADGKGWPDLFAVHPKWRKRFVAELKINTKPRLEQKQWLQWMEICGIPAFTWTPKDWGEIERTARGEIDDGAAVLRAPQEAVP